MKTKFLFLICLIGLGSCVQEDNGSLPSPTETIEIERSYSEIKDYELDLDNCFSIEQEHYYLYFYSTTCSHCEELKNVIIAEALDRQDIFFIKSSNKIQLTNDRDLVIGAENPGDISILGYPTLLKIDSGKCVKNCVGNSEIKSELNSYH